MGLGYPGGPKVDKLAQQGKPSIEFPKTHFENLDFSFSGIKTAVINMHHKNPDVSKEDLCMSFEKAVTEVLRSYILIKNRCGRHRPQRHGTDVLNQPKLHT